MSERPVARGAMDRHNAMLESVRGDAIATKAVERCVPITEVVVTSCRRCHLARGEDCGHPSAGLGWSTSSDEVPDECPLRDCELTIRAAP